jgi:hypothetical protein
MGWPGDFLFMIFEAANLRTSFLYNVDGNNVDEDASLPVSSPRGKK